MIPIGTVKLRSTESQDTKKFRAESQWRCSEGKLEKKGCGKGLPHKELHPAKRTPWGALFWEGGFGEALRHLLQYGRKRRRGRESKRDGRGGQVRGAREPRSGSQGVGAQSSWGVKQEKEEDMGGGGGISHKLCREGGGSEMQVTWRIKSGGEKKKWGAQGIPGVLDGRE